MIVEDFSKIVKETAKNDKVKKGVLDTIFDIIEGAANLLGLGSVVRKVAKYANGGEANFSYSDLTTIINTLTSAAKKKGEKYITMLNNKLNSMPIGTSGRLKNIVQDAKRKLKEDIANASANQRMGEVAEENARNAANEISNMSTGQIASGQADEKRKQMEDWAQKAANFYSNEQDPSSALANKVEERIN